jgi:peptide/nickel transport system substrate-binding protein
MNVWIVSRQNGAAATMQDYNSGRAAIGTGPYKFVRWVPGDRIDLVRNDGYVGAQPAWEHVIYRPLTNDARRALLIGDVDIINAVASNDIANLEHRPGFSVTSIPSDRIIYFGVDVGRWTISVAAAPDGTS